MNRTLMLELLRQIPPQRLGMMISRMQRPEEDLGRGMFDTKSPGLAGGTVNMKGPFQSFGGGVPEVRR